MSETKSHSKPGTSHCTEVITHTHNVTMFHKWSEIKRSDIYEDTYAGHARQISKVSGCGIERIGSLSFSMHGGSCFSHDNYMLLCFGNDDKKQCYRGSDALGQFSKVQKSTHEHWRLQMAASKGELKIQSKTLKVTVLRVWFCDWWRD